MRRIFKTWVAAALACCCASALPAGAQPNGQPAAKAQAAKAQALQQAQVTGVRVLAVGVFTSAVESRAFSPTIADGIHDSARDFVLVRRGAVVEARLDTGIGLRYQVTGSPKGAVVVVDVVVRHPRMVNPDTQLPMTHSTAQYERVIGNVEHSVWSFDNPADLVPGEYVLEVLHRGRVLARQAFQVTVPE